MPWFVLRPRDPADPRWPVPERPTITLKADDPDDARARFAQAYPSVPFGTPASPTPDVGAAGFHADGDGLVVAETQAPPSPDA